MTLTPGSLFVLFLKPSFIRRNEKAKPGCENVLHNLPVLADAVICHISWLGCELILFCSSLPFHFFLHPWVLSGLLALSSNLSCMPGLTEMIFLLFYCFCSHLHVSLSNLTLSGSHSNSITKSEKETDCGLCSAQSWSSR